MENPPTTVCHVVAMPYPGRGHINPLINFCKLLVSKNPDILVTIVLTEEWLGFIGSEPRPHNIRFGSIPNVIPSEVGRANDFLAFLEAVMTKMEAPFEQLLDRLQPPPTIILYDTYLFWVVAVANRRSIPVASFWTTSASFFSVLQHYHLLEQHGHYPLNVLENGENRVDYIPGVSPTRLADFPLTDGSWRVRQMLQWALKAFQWVPKVQYMLFPSIYELEPEAIDVLKAEFSMPIYSIGPALPYSNLKHTTINHNDSTYFQWLDNQPSASVLYISHGSFLSTSRAQMEEMAAGLRESGVRFLWVARGSEASRLKEICGNMGLVLGWCDQLRVLRHGAIGGFWSHCGWNSIGEGVFSGIPFLTFPMFMDQPVNGKMIVEDWKVGWRVRNGVKLDTLVGKDEICGVLKKFMDLDSVEGRDVRKRAREVQQICVEAIANGGSCEVNINAFVRDVLHLHNAKP
ncbi:UDP-glycosyltransferase 87A1-like isoform X1 [Senna tora]|uniref:UDP-glycosyltransferase 87A1-like isoform X1 n=1 Tax=Senna tora TaxID=362788 RepID=A0A834T6W7_9FABA|nr:UDP-glycosyltransferase 87A1-like isoform X1 [Senna tora]